MTNNEGTAVPDVLKKIESPRLSSEPAALTVGAIASVLVGACCVGPLVLVSVGLGGARLASLRLLEPYRPIFIAIALVALVFAWRRIYRPVTECKAGEVCAAPAFRRGYKAGFWVVAVLFLAMLTFPYVTPLFY